MKIKINFLTIVLAFIVSITGMYKEFLIIFSIIIIHEMGHLLFGIIYKWNIDKIEIYPYGGCVKFNELLNRPMKEELIILIAGPLTQILFFLVIIILYKNNVLSLRNYLLFKNYHYNLLIFNLLPIYPLDGGRILNLFLNKILPYKKSNILVVIISIIVSMFLTSLYKSVNYFGMAIMLVVESILYLKQQNYLLNKLLLERYLYNYRFKKRCNIRNKNNFYKEKYHYIKINDHYVSETNYLNKRYGG